MRCTVTQNTIEDARGGPPHAEHIGQEMCGHAIQEVQSNYLNFK
jgi:hypothetical protein